MLKREVITDPVQIQSIEDQVRSLRPWWHNLGFVMWLICMGSAFSAEIVILVYKLAE